MSEAAVLWVYAGFATVFGLIIGSFLNVCIVRWPQDRSVILPRSTCPACGTPLSARDNIPVVSWLALGGKCRTCETPIPITYPLVEVLGGLLGFLTFQRFFDRVSDFDAAHILAFLVFFAFVSALVVLTLTDIRHLIIPNETSIYAVPFAILGILFLDALGYEGWLALTWQESVIGSLVSASAMATMAIGWVALFGSVGLGTGDIKLMALVGAVLGLKGAIFVLFVGSIIGSIIGITWMLLRGRAHLPFGPPLALAAALWVFYGDEIGLFFVPSFG